MSVKESELKGLMEDVVKDLREKIKGGDADPRDIANAIKLLKDNGIQFDVDKPDVEEVREKVKVLPFPVQKD